MNIPHTFPIQWYCLGNRLYIPRGRGEEVISTYWCQVVGREIWVIVIIKVLTTVLVLLNSEVTMAI